MALYGPFGKGVAGGTNDEPLHPRPDDAARAEEVATQVVDSRANLPLVRGMTEFERGRWIAGITAALLTFAAQAAQRENETCARVRPSRWKMNRKLWGPTVPGSGSYECGWNDAVIAYDEAIRARHAPTGRGA